MCVFVSPPGSHMIHKYLLAHILMSQLCDIIIVPGKPSPTSVRVAVCCSACCSMLQRVLQCVAVGESTHDDIYWQTFSKVGAYYSVLQRVLQCVAVGSPITMTFTGKKIGKMFLCGEKFSTVSPVVMVYGI